MPLKTYPILFGFLFLAVTATAQVTDTLMVDWEALPGVPDRTFGFAKSGDRVFCVNGYSLSNSSLYFSDDGGEHWMKHPAFDPGVDHVVASDSLVLVFTHKITLLNQGYIVITDYAIHRSTDGGATFSEAFTETYTITQPGGGSFGEFKGQFLSDTVCIAGIRTNGSLNSNGWINFHSTDGGFTWVQSSNFSMQFSFFADGKWRGANYGMVCVSDTPDFANSICCPTGGNGVGGGMLVGAHWNNGAWYLCTNKSELYTSTDDGLTWQVDNLLNTFGRLSGFHFHDGHFFLTSSQGLLRSAGATPDNWEVVFQNPFAHLPACTNFEHFGDEFWLDAFATGVVHSTDGGQTWAVKNEGLSRRFTDKLYSAGGNIWGSRRINFYDGYESLLAVYTLKPDTTWAPLTAPDIQGKSLTEFIFEQGGNIWMQRPYPELSLLLSKDSGQNWQEVSLPASFTWYLRGATVDADSRLWFWMDEMAAFTTDEGQSWTEVPLPANNFYGIRSLTAKAEAIVAGGREGLYRSTDYGQNWQKTPLPLTTNAYRIFQLPGNNLVYFNGDNGESWHSANGGLDWAQTGIGFGNSSASGSPVFWLKHGEDVLALATGGKLFITHNFGASWTLVDSVPGYGQPVVLDGYLWFSSWAYGGTWRTSADSLLSTVNAMSDNFSEKTLNLRVFPNPTSGEFFVEMDLPEPMKMSIELVDMLGRRVAVVSNNQLFQKGKQRLKMDASAWPSGIYLLHLQADGHSFSKKIIKQ